MLSAMSEQPPWETHIQPGWGTPQPPPQQPPQQPPQGGGWNQGPYAPPQQPQYPPNYPPPAPPQFPSQTPPGPPAQDARPPVPPSGSGFGPYPGFGQQPTPPQFTPPQMPGQPLQSAPPPAKGGRRNIWFIVAGVVAIVGAAAAIFFLTNGNDDKKAPSAAGGTPAPSTPAATPATPSSGNSFPDNSYTSSPGAPGGTPSSAAAPSTAAAPPSGGGSLDKDSTDKTPFTQAGLVSPTFTDSKNVAYTLRGAGAQPCDKVGDAVVQQIVKSAKCDSFMAASWTDQQNRIIVSAMVIPYPDADTAQKIYQKLGGAAHTGDYKQWCPPAGQPAADACDKLAKVTAVTREGKFGSFHRYLLITTAVYADLRHDDSQKDWLNAAADAAFQNTLPGQ